MWRCLLHWKTTRQPDQRSDSVLILWFLFLKEVTFGLEPNGTASVYPYSHTLTIEILSQCLKQYLLASFPGIKLGN